MKYTFLAFMLIFMLYPFLAKKHLKIYLTIVTFVLSALAYFIVPQTTMDLYRYTNIMDYIREMGWNWAMNRYGDSNPLATVFLYGVSLLNNNNMLPAITAALTYGFTLALFYKAAKRFKVRNSEVFIAFLFLMLNLNYCYVINVVRIYIAYAILAYFLYMDLVEKKHRPLCFAVYVLLCYFHYAILVFVILRLIFIITGKLNGILSFIATATVPVILFLGYWFVDLFTGSSSLLTYVGEKIEGYKTYETFGIWQFLASVAKIGVFIIIGIITIALCNELRKKYVENSLAEKAREVAVINKFTVFCFYVTLSVVTFIANYQFVLRTPYFIQMLISAPFLFLLTNLRKTNNNYYNALSAFIIVESVVHYIYLLAYVYPVLEFSFVF